MKTIKGKPKRIFTKKKGFLCTKCSTIIVSMDRHDFCSCKCGPNEGIFIDGGNDYSRFGGKGFEKGEYKEVIIQILEKPNETNKTK